MDRMFCIDDDILLLVGVGPMLIIIILVMDSSRNVLKDIYRTLLLLKLILLSLVVIHLYLPLAL